MRLQRATVLAGLLAAGSGAAAQRLNLGESSITPKAGEGRAALALAELLEKEAAEEGGIDGAGRAARRLGATLLRQGEGGGPEGAEAVLAGLTIAAKRKSIDGLLQSAPAGARQALGHGPASPASLAPRDIDLLLRDSFGAGAAGEECGWLGGPAGAQPLGLSLEQCSALAASRHIDDKAGAALREMVEIMRLAPTYPGYQRSALGWALLITEAGGAAGELPDWLPMDARDRLRADLSIGLELCLEKPEQSRASLRRTATYLRILRACDELPDAPAAAREAAAALVLAPEGQPLRDPAAVERVGAALRRATDLLAAPQRAPDPATLVRQVRPMLGHLAAAHARAAEPVRRALPAMLASPDPLTDPGTLAPVEALAQATRDLGMPARLSRMLAEWPDAGAEPFEPVREPAPARAIAPVAEQVRKLGVSLGRDGESASALADLREIAALADDLIALPGEADVRADEPPTAWRLVTGGQTSRLRFVIEQARDAWVRAHSSDQFESDRAAAAAAFGDLAAAMETLTLGVASEAMRLEWGRGDAPLINAWPGWELSRQASDTIADGLRERCGELASVIARGDEMPRAAELGAAVRADYAAPLLFARLESLLPESWTPACTPLDELGSGPPLEAAWLLGHRHALAQVCRSAFEAAAADGQTRAEFRAHANREALAVLDALGP
ncbi:MAG TPA: hypothetical protein VFF69_03450 [Phycisphaerales bacterium]|nr:hypothetical protein [Phycisphaerales bacterium]